MEIMSILEFDQNGNVHGLWTDEIDFYQLGQVSNVRRASWILFDEARQEWFVIDADTNKIVHRNKNRSQAIEWERQNFCPGGPYYSE